MIPALRDLLRRHDVRAAYLFGSALQDRGSCLSDLDVAVLPPPGLDDRLGYYSDLYGDLCQLFRADNVDLVLLNQADLALQARVVLDGHCILEGDGAADLEERVSARHADMAAWRQENWNVTQQLARRGATGEINMIDRALSAHCHRGNPRPGATRDSKDRAWGAAGIQASGNHPA